MARLLVLGVALTLAAFSPPAHAELAAWDTEKVGALTKQLEGASKALYDTFYKQPQVGGQKRDYHRLKQDVRRVRNEARHLADALTKGDGREETLPVYEDLMQYVRRARTNAGHVFTTTDVQARASEVRGLLNQLAPYYDPDAAPLQPATR